MIGHDVRGADVVVVRRASFAVAVGLVQKGLGKRVVLDFQSGHVFVLNNNKNVFHLFNLFKHPYKNVRGTNPKYLSCYILIV
jgi:hypothetical protein